MLKNIAVSALTLPVMLCCTEDRVEETSTQTITQLLTEKGYPLPDGGIILKPSDQFPQNEMFKEQRASDEASIKKYGYIKKSSPEIQSLLNFKQGNKKFSPKNLTISADSELFRSVNDIQMAYRYYGVPASVMTQELAAGPAGTYLKGQGWTGAAQTFEHATAGTCIYSETNVKLNHSSALVAQETVTDDINGKVTQKYVTGEENYGFKYDVDWFDNAFYHSLECAQPNFSTETMQAVVNLAIAIDNNSH